MLLLGMKVVLLGMEVLGVSSCAAAPAAAAACAVGGRHLDNVFLQVIKCLIRAALLINVDVQQQH